MLVEYLSVKDREIFEKVHSKEQVYGSGRELHGWYTKDNLRVAFYYTPSWYSRQKMYWIYGWNWEPKE